MEGRLELSAGGTGSYDGQALLAQGHAPCSVQTLVQPMSGLEHNTAARTGQDTPGEVSSE